MALSNKELIAAIAEKSPLDALLNTGDREFSNILKKEVPVVKKEAVPLLPNQIYLSSITDNVLPASGIDHVITVYPEDTWDEEHRENIPEVDPYFHWDADVLEEGLLSYELNTPWLCVGPPGTGKTSAGKQLAALLRQPYARFNGKDGIEPAAFLGYMTIKDGDTLWRDGLMAQAVEHGYYMAIDEIFKLPPGIQMAMQSLYERDGFLMLDEKPGTIKDKHIYPRKEFRILGTDNTKGTGDDLDKYPAGQMQDISSIDRFGITTEVGYLRPEVERKMLHTRYENVSEVTIKRAVAFANLVRDSFMESGDLSLTMSPRGLMVVCELIEKGISLERALTMTYLTKLGDDSEVNVAKGYITSAI